MKKMIRFVQKNIVPLSAILLVTLVFTACKKNNDSNYNSPVAGLMAFNLAPDKSPIVITLSGNSLTNTPISYTNFTGVYLPIYPGTRTVDAVDYTTGSALASTSQNFDVNKYYSVFTLGANGSYRNLVVADGLDSLPTTTGQAFVRYINAIPDSVNTPAVTITGGPDVTNKPSPFASISTFNTYTPGDINVKVSNGSSVNVNRTITVEKDKVYTVLLTGLPGATDSTKAVQIKYITNGTVTP